jgi:glucose/arabinose dehydrogenase
MGRLSRRATGGVLLGAVLVGATLVGSCRWLLPERFAVNAPIGHLLFQRGAEPPPPALLGSRIRVLEGWRIDLFARVPNARMLRFSSRGDLLVSVPRRGEVVLLARDGDGDGRSDSSRVLLEGLSRPHGLDFHEGSLYVAETDAVGRIAFDPAAGSVSGPLERVVTGLPAEGNHWTRTLRFGPDGWMYVSVGSSCNVCAEQDPRRAALLRFRPDGTGAEIHATGLRNTVGFDWQPGTGELYGTDNGRDLLGDDFPPCELNRIVAGGFYGWPLANGAREPDPDLGAGQDARIAASHPPVHAFRAHSAPLGIHFVRSPAAPSALRGAALVALHGSWNRTRKDGYAVVSLHWSADGSIVERDFVWGFLEDENVIGRPVDVTEGPDGAFYVSDDYAGAIYRVAWSGSEGTARAAAAPTAGPREEPGADPLAGLTPEERGSAAARGAGLFARHECAGCHDAAQAKPGVVPVPLAGLAARHDLASLSAFLAAPTPPMPVVPLSDAERRDVAIFLLSR